MYTFKRKGDSVDVYRDGKFVARISTSDPDAVLDVLKTNAGRIILEKLFPEDAG